MAHGKLTLGAFFEYGNANYDSFNSFVNAASVHGKGGIDYTSGGVLAHFEFNPTARGNAWLESPARFGEASVGRGKNKWGKFMFSSNTPIGLSISRHR
ncbi:hypothetical protein FACS189443_3740 [Planctomycetales bacterium]|nr:hypothetical protein FACS189443_3740 [Planctomycetales bacterium]